MKMHAFAVALVLVMLIMTSNAFKVSTTKRSFSNAQLSDVNIDKSAFIKATSAAVVAAPLAANAAEGSSAFIWPLGIAFFTMIPFLYYQQALRPKERTVKQIPLDENLREIKPKKNKFF